MPPELRVPAETSSDALLGAFLDYVAGLGLELYPAQEEAIFEILAGKHLVLTTPTGSGKSLVATAFLFKALAEGKRGFWSCPVKALVNEKFFDLCAAFGPDKVGLVTGDASVNRQAPILCGTAEILSNLAVRSARSPADYVVMDEFHYYADRERGIAWQLPLITLKQTTFALMSATLGDTTAIEGSLERFTGREVAVVRGMVRPVPLDFEYRESPLHETISELVREGRAPVYLVNFTQRAAAEEVQNLMSLDFATKAQKEALKDSLRSERWPSPYGKELQRFLRHGLGLHHAGLLPRYRRVVERLAQRGLLNVVSGTDTLGVGVNIPIRTVLFTRLCKFDGEKDVILSVREFKQIAGRAGRKGFDERGWVVAQAPSHVIENKRLAAKAAATGRKVHKQKPPDKGYIHWDKGTFDRLVSGTPEPLESRFAVSHSLLLSLLQGEQGDPRRGAGYGRLLELVAESHESPNAKRRHKHLAAGVFRTLRGAGLITLVRDERAHNPIPVPSPALQRDFSLHQTLALYVVETLAHLDPALESYPFDALTLVESILENPRVVLMAQLSRLKQALVADLKAQGVEYEERMEKLDALEWPKPNRDFIYDSFNAFAARHPWVGNENIAPKSIARDLMERFCSFNDYVREYGLERAEGVLLRYLSQAYKGLAQTIPVDFRSPELEELSLTLSTLVRGVDGSLLEEWEALQTPEGTTPPPKKPAEEEPLGPHGPPPVDLRRDSRARAVRIRSELHRLLGALARRDYEEAAAVVRIDPAAPEPFGAERFSRTMSAYYEEHKALLTTPEARHPKQTTITPRGGDTYGVIHALLDPEGLDDWAIHATVDLSTPTPDDEPLLELERLGP